MMEETKFHAEDGKMLDGALPNSVAVTTWRQGFVHPRSAEVAMFVFDDCGLWISVGEVNKTVRAGRDISPFMILRSVFCRSRKIRAGGEWVAAEWKWSDSKVAGQWM